MVTLQLKFYHEVDAKAFQPPEGAKRTNEKTWHTTVFVQDQVEFSEFVGWKSSDTQEQWDRYAAALEEM